MTIGIDQLLSVASERGADYLYLCIGVPPTIRICNVIHKLQSPAIESLDETVKDLTNNQSFDYVFNGIYIFNAMEIDVTIIKTISSFKISLRFYPKYQIRISDLYLPNQVEDLLKHESGLVVMSSKICGGRSTTMCAIAKSQENSIIISQDHSISSLNLPKHCDQQMKLLNAIKKMNSRFILIDFDLTHQVLHEICNIVHEGFLVIVSISARSATSALMRILNIASHDARDLLMHSLLGVIHQDLKICTNGRDYVPLMEVIRMNSMIRSMLFDNKLKNIDSIINGDTNGDMLSRKMHLDMLMEKGLFSSDSITLNHLPNAMQESDF